MQNLSSLEIDLTPSLWALGVFAMSVMLLYFAERFAHTRARNRTRRTIETTAPRNREKLQK